MTVYISEPKNCNRKLLQVINTFSKVAGHKINTQKSAVLYIQMTSGKLPFTIALKYPGKTLTKEVKDF